MTATTLLTHALTLAALLAPAAPEAEDSRVAEVRSTLESGDAAGALDQAVVALEVLPESWRLLDVASEAALAAERTDEALHYTRLALAEIPTDDRDLRKQREALEARLLALDPLAARRQEVLDEFAESVYRLAEFAKGRKFYANAVDIYLRCMGSGYEDRARRALEKLYDNDKAVTALIDSGIDVPVETEESRKSPEWIALQDEKYSDWEEPQQAESDLYTISSNAGYLLTHQVLRAMEQMNYFLREMFDYKTRGGGMRRAYIDIHKSKQEFMDVREVAANVGGYFSPDENRIVAYDSRPQGEPLAELWSTLFHEGTHQFVHAISPNLVPAWMNEGTACYFEGTRMLPNGKVEANLIPDGRLKNLVTMLEADAVDVTEVISYFRPGSYSGQYYPYGWGLVYFIRNFEDEQGERIYLPVFNEYVLTYRTGGEHDVLERWLDYFVREVDRDGIESLDDWLEQWEAWIRELHTIHFGGAEQADKLIDKARRQVQLGHPDHAVETFRWATRKRPGDPAATFGLAEVLELVDQDDAAIYYYRQAAAWADAQVDPAAGVPGFTDTQVAEFSERCTERIGAIYSKMIEGFTGARTQFVADVTALVGEYQQAELPRASLALVADAERTVGRLRDLEVVRRDVLEESAIEIRRRRRLDLSDDLAHFTGNVELWEAEGDALVAQGDGLRTVVYDGELPDAYRFEATLELVNRGQGLNVVGLVFGANVGGRQMIGYLDTGSLQRLRLEQTEMGRVPALAGTLKEPFAPEGEFRLALEVRRGEVEVFVDGESVGKANYADEELEGGVGFFFQNARVRISEPRLLY